jgi:hypothetical protein
VSDTPESLTADESFEAEGRVNLDMEPEDALRLMLSTDLREPETDEEP